VERNQRGRGERAGRAGRTGRTPRVERTPKTPRAPRRPRARVSRRASASRTKAVALASVAVVLVVGAVALVASGAARSLYRGLRALFEEDAPRVTIPEGFSRFDIADRLAARGVCARAAFLSATTDAALLAALEVPGTSAEGYLFPDTYALAPGSDAHSVVRRMVANFRARTRPLFAEHADALTSHGLTAHDALVLASVVEKEAVVADEQPVIAGVFWNRLRRADFTPHRLQADPTVSYGCRAAPEAAPSCARFDGRRITRTMTNDAANPYNTYRRDGLPPGPISSPGLGAIRAALAPAAHDYFYFVARGGRRHTFSRTLAEHDSAVGTWHELRDEAAR
jgi:UPF0755 protein